MPDQPPQPKNPITGYGSDFKPTAPVDGDPWAFDAVMISEGPSASGTFYYPPEWINDPNTTNLYMGAQSYINHMSEEEMINRPEGDMNELVGYWSNVQAKTNMMTGRLHIVPTESNRRIRDYCLASIRYRQSFPDKNLFGVSIVQIGDWVPFEFQGKNYRKVINTKEVLSCDIVTKPGRGGMILAPAPVAQESKRKWFDGYMAESLRVMDLDFLKQKESGASATGTAVLDRPGTKPLSEAEAGTGTQLDLLPILTELRDKVAAADDSMPLKKDLRRGLDNAVTLAQLGTVTSEGERQMADATKQEITTKPGMSVAINHAHPPAGADGSTPPGAGPEGTTVPTAHQDPGADNEEEEAAQCDEAANTYQKMAESESESGKKAGFMKQSAAFKKMAEAKRAKAAESKKQKQEESETAKREEESKRLSAMTEAEKEEESNRQILTDLLLRESGLNDPTQAFIRENTKGKGVSEVKRMVESARTTLMREANPPLNPARPGVSVDRGGTAFGTAFKGFFKNGGRN